MGSSRTRNSTRAGKARSVKHSPTLRRKPTLSPAAMAKRLATRKRATGLGAAAVDALREARDGVPAAVLTDIRRHLQVAQAVVYVCSAALRHQNADSDNEIATTLQRCVGDELDRQIERLDVLI